MKALSINQPWAWLIVNGFKDIENRDWPTRYRGTVLVHAGMKMSNDDFLDVKDMISRMPETIEAINNHPMKCTPRILKEQWMGGIVGQVDIVDCVSESTSPWFFGKYGFVLANPVAFDVIRPCKGALGFFEPDYNSRYSEKKPKEKKEKPQTQGTLL